jgi:hypothetical protein
MPKAAAKAPLSVFRRDFSQLLTFFRVEEKKIKGNLKS